MPRDGSGVYTLPAGNPVVTNTVIASSWANSTLSDIAAQLNNVFTRDGLLGPTGPFKLMDGTVNAPGLAWNSEPGLGWFRPSASIVWLASQGKAVVGADANTSNFTELSLRPRAAGASSIRFYSTPSDAAAAPFFQVSAGASNATIAMRDAAGAPSTTLPIFYQAGLHNFTGPGTFSGLLNANAGLGVSGGDINANGGINSGGIVTAGVAMVSPNFQMPGGMPLWNQDASYVYFSMAAGWYWLYTRATGQMEWRRDGGPSTIFSPNGEFHAGGAVYSGNSVYLDNGAGPGIIGGGAPYFRFTADNWRLQWSAGTLYFINQSGTVLHTINGSGDVTNNGMMNPTNGYYSRLMATGQNGPNRWCWFWNNDAHLYLGVDATNQGWVTLNTSDERIKKNIATLDSDTDAFMAIRAISYQWNSALRDLTKIQAGFSAQNVAQVLPSALVGDINSPVEEDGSIHMPASVDTNVILAHTVAQVQKLINRITALENA